MTATTASGAATLATTQFPANLLRAWPSDPDGKDCYPIATFTWLLLYQKYDNAQIGEAVKKFVSWGLADGQKFAEELGYIPLPKEVVDKGFGSAKNRAISYLPNRKRINKLWQLTEIEARHHR